MKLPDWALFCERCGERVIRLSSGDGEDAPTHHDIALELAREMGEVEDGAYELPTMVIPAAALRMVHHNEEAEQQEEPASARPRHEAPASERDVAPELPAEESLDAEGQATAAPEQDEPDHLGTQAVAEEPDVVPAEPAADEAREGEPIPADDDQEEPAGESDAPGELDESAQDDAEPEPAAEQDDVEPEPAAEQDDVEPEPAAEQDDEPAAEPDDDLAAEGGAIPFVVLSKDEAGKRYRERDVSSREGSGIPRFTSSAHHVPRRSEVRRQGPPMALVAGIATAVMVFIALALFRIVSAMPHNTSGDTPQVVGKVVSRAEAERVVASLDGWWKTNRALDGRYWHISGKNVQTYAADGKLASETTLDATKVERMSTGPGGIDKPGYYLRDVAFYLTDDDPDTLYALAGDGSADEEANLIRTEEPTFEKPAPVEPEPSYILPESATRVYEYGELDVLDNHVLFLARNEIYARHGYIFQEGSEAATYFAGQSWYTPNEAYTDDLLSDIERQNIDMIRSVEYNHGSEYQWS